MRSGADSLHTPSHTFPGVLKKEVHKTACDLHWHRGSEGKDRRPRAGIKETRCYDSIVSFKKQQEQK